MPEDNGKKEYIVGRDYDQWIAAGWEKGWNEGLASKP